jgi:hypothetical protein
MIAFVWLISLAVASPIVAGLNDTPERRVNECSFNNNTFLICSSMFSFYMPTLAMVVLYYKIFKVIRSRAKKSSAVKQVHKKGASVASVHNIAKTSRNTSLSSSNTEQAKTVVMDMSKTVTVLTNANTNSNSDQNSQRNNKLSSGAVSNKKNANKKNAQKVNLISNGIFKLKNKNTNAICGDMQKVPNTANSNANLTSEADVNFYLLTPLVNHNNCNNRLLSEFDHSALIINDPTESDSAKKKIAPPTNSANTSPIDNNNKNTNNNRNNNNNSLIGDSINKNFKPKENNTKIVKERMKKAKSLSNASNLPNEIKPKKHSRAKSAISVLRSQSSALSIASNSKEKKVTKTLAIVLCVFLVCW